MTMKNKKEIKVLELFGGVGATTMALERLGFKINIIDYVDFDKVAVKAFNIYNYTYFKPVDIRDYHFSKSTQIDLALFGSPCQDFSKMGKQEGGTFGSGTRSSLVFEALRVIEEMKQKPKVVIWENVASVFRDKKT